MIVIEENDSAKIIQLKSGEYEIWMKLFYTTGSKKGQLIDPTDESFGVSCWTCYTSAKANRIFEEITTGKRGIIPMLESF